MRATLLWTSIGPIAILGGLLASGVGCGHKGPTKQPEPKQPIVNQLPDGPPLLTPGERMNYRLSLRGVDLATYEIAVGETTTEIGGRTAIPVQAHARSSGFAALAVKVDDYFTSWIDVATGRALRWHTAEVSGEDSVEHTEVQFHERTGNSVPVTNYLDEQTPKPEPQTVSMPDVWDYNAFLLALRAWEGADGSKVSVEVFRSRWLWHIDMTLAAHEQLVTELGEYPTRRFDAKTYKLARDGSRVADSEPREFSVWISDDDGRVPLRVVSESDHGDVEMKIADYQPGNGARLRD